jgi:hypothetical protein
MKKHGREDTWESENGHASLCLGCAQDGSRTTLGSSKRSTGLSYGDDKVVVLKDRFPIKLIRVVS